MRRRYRYRHQREACRSNSYLGFFIHLAVYSVVITAKMYGGLFAGEPFGFVAPMLGWGIGVFFHGFKVFVVKNHDLVRWLNEAPEDVKP